MQPSLTPRQRQVLALVWDGLTRPAIAHRLGLMPHTVDNILNDARRRVDAGSTIGLLRWWIEHQPVLRVETKSDTSTFMHSAFSAWADDWNDPAMDAYDAGPSDPTVRLPGATTGGPAS